MFARVTFLFIITGVATSVRADDDRPSTQIAPGSMVQLMKAWPALAGAPKSDLGTIEVWIRPDAEAVSRPRSFIVTLSNRVGNDLKSVGIAMHKGVVRADLLGAHLVSSQAIPADEWCHIALTINMRTVNKRARLWVNGKLAAEQLVLEFWPEKFDVAEMLGDRWALNRVFSGRLGDVRFSKHVRYTQPFTPPVRCPEDANTAFVLDGMKIPL